MTGRGNSFTQHTFGTGTFSLCATAGRLACTRALVGRAPIGEPSAAADSARRVNIKDRERTILVFEVGANKQSAIRHMSR